MNSPSRKRRRGPLTQDFELLASRYDDFASEWREVSSSNDQSNNVSLSSKSTPSFQLSLTRALLDFHFGLKLPSLPEHCLCPPVPNRWFYCDWVLHELMPALTNPLHFYSQYQVQNVGLDIGTGASVIYPLLLVTNDPSLRMLASEVDPISIASSQTNIDANNLKDRISLIPVDTKKETNKGKGPLLQTLHADKTTAEYLDFVLTNPPFFEEQPPIRADGRARTPMTMTESIYADGGEVGWVLDILRDSLTTLSKIGWYTTMLSKKTSFVKLKRILLGFLGPGHVRVAELEVGTMTRWFLAWTYHRPCGQTLGVETRSLDFVVQHLGDESINGNVTRDEVATRLKEYCANIPGWDLACSVATIKDEGGVCSDLVVTENSPPIPQSYMVEASQQLPARVLMGGVLEASSVTAKNWLPEEGHFVLHFRIVEQVGNATDGVRVTANAFRHSNRGSKAVEKILSRVEGEVCRTNRRWRRLLSRQKKSNCAVPLL